MSYYTLSGNITTNRIKETNPNFVNGYDMTKLENIGQVWSELQTRGTLRIQDGTYIIEENLNQVLLTFHLLELDNATIITNTSNLTILCNEFRFRNSQIISFEGDNIKLHTLEKDMVSGEDGQHGKDGLDAGGVNFFTTDKIYSTGRLRIRLWGQDGGDGANGADGADGPQGARGTNCSDGGYQCNRDCGNGHKGGKGQRGGNGGNGGNGGDGGKFDFRLHGYRLPSEFIFDFVGKGGYGGNEGYSGAGGNGGKGGRPGSMGCGSFCNRHCYSGPVGDRGENGFNGKPGSKGTDSFIVNANFDVPYLEMHLASLQNKALLEEILDVERVIESGSIGIKD